MESLADNVKDKTDHRNIEYFNEFLCGYTDIFTNNIYARKDYTCHNIRGLVQNKDIVVAEGDKNSSIIVLKNQIM